MKTTEIFAILALALGLLVCPAKLSTAAQMGTAFTYQGRLLDGNAPADGLYDFEFRLYDAPDPNVATQQGDTIKIDDVDLIDGYFVVDLDFGSDVFTGDARWLQIAVGPGELGGPGGPNEPNAYTILQPRQEVAPVPYAIYAQTTSLHSLDAADGSPTDAVYVDNEGNVGIGTTSPAANLEIGRSGDLLLKASGTDSGDIIFQTSTGMQKARIWASGTVNRLYLSSGDNTPDLTVAENGNVGIGTASPAVNLEIGNGGKLLLKGSSATPGDTGDLIFQDSSGTQKGRIWSSPAVGVERLYLSSGDNTPDLTVGESGRVGVGTASPTHKLHVNGSTSISGNVGIGTSSSNAKLDVDGHIAISYPDPYLRTDSTNKHMVISGGSGWADTGATMVLRGANAADNAHGIELYTGGSERVRIRSDGRVGIGTASPSAGTLHVMSSHFVGVYSECPNNTAVHGESESSNGVYGYSRNDAGVQGNGPIGVHGYGDKGVYGLSGDGTGVYGESVSGHAGYFKGTVRVAGALIKAGGSFQIDHPLDPENKYLQHSFVESPDMMNVYNGNVTLDENGQVVVQLPEYFEALNRDFRYQLTCIGGFAPVYIAKKISDNRFKIAGGKSGMEVSWQVT
ncbi:MAG: hypothetical protein ACYSYV_02435, partial [Planctomycetota bacterium]